MSLTAGAFKSKSPGREYMALIQRKLRGTENVKERIILG
jgi:hypothetical protein